MKNIKDRDGDGRFIRAYMDSATVAEYLSVHPMTISKWVRAGIIPSVKIGGSRRIPKDRLDAFLEGKMKGRI